MIHRWPPPYGLVLDRTAIRVWTTEEGAAAVARGDVVEVKNERGDVIGWAKPPAPWSPYPAPPPGRATPVDP